MSSTREREALEARLVELLYDELPPDEAEALRTQLGEHPEVAERLAQWQALRRAAAQVPEIEPDPQVRYDILRAARLAADEAATEAAKPPWWAFLVNLSFAPALAALGLVVLGAGMVLVLTRTYDDAAIPRQGAAEAPAKDAPTAAQAPEAAAIRPPAGGEADESAGTETLAKGGALAAPGGEGQADDGDAPVALADEEAPAGEVEPAPARADAPELAEPAEPPAYAQRENRRASRGVTKAKPKMPAKGDPFGDPFGDGDPAPPAEERARDRTEAAGAKTATKQDAPAPESKKREAARRPAPRTAAPDQTEDGLLDDDLKAAPADRFAPPPPPAPRRAEPPAAPDPEPSTRSAAAAPPTATPPPVAPVVADADEAPAAEAEARAEKAEEKAAEADQRAGSARTPSAAQPLELDSLIGGAQAGDDAAGAGPSAPGAGSAGAAAQATLEAARTARDRGDLRTAAARYESFLSANPGHPGLQGAMFETAQTYERLGDTGRARQLYRLVVGGGGALASQAQLRLTALDRAAEQQQRDPPRAKPQPNARPRKSMDAETLERK